MNEICLFLCGCNKKSPKIFPLNEVAGTNAVCLSEHADMTHYFLQDIMYTLNIIYVLDNSRKNDGKKSVEYYVNQLGHILHQYKYYSLSFCDSENTVYVLTYHTYNAQNQMKVHFEGLLNEFEIMYDKYEKYIQHISEIFENYDKRYRSKLSYLFRNNKIIVDNKLMQLSDVKRMFGV